jgi:RND superfamily putative drug exporter
MRQIVKWRWLVLALWLAAAAGLVLTSPNLAELVREHGQITVPDGYPSVIADEMLADLGESGSSTVLVFHRESGLTDADLEAVKGGVERLKDDSEALGVVSVTSPFDSEELAAKMLSEDGTTALVLLGVEFDGRTAAEEQDALYGALADVEVEHYITGGWVIAEDVIQSSEEGVKKTELITIVFILVILIVVFRSVVAPLIPLLTVGLSYLAAQAVVAYLAEYADFPLSNFTQIFMVAVMFGIGTDYCILLISRFKEELAKDGDKVEAILRTYRTAGKTVLFAGLAVLVGFTSIGLSTFSLYRSAVAVAVGVAVMLIALVTIVPFFMAVLGKALFWPVRGSLEHKESRLWGAVGSFALKRPLGALAIIAVLAVPLLVGYKNAVTFNQLDEIGDRYGSVRGFNIISESFGPGETLPTTVVWRSETPLDTPEGLAAVEQISRRLLETDGVASVRSATRPTGQPLEQLQVVSQVSELDSGLGQGGEGLSKISDGLAEASEELAANAPQLEEAVGGAKRLAQGTEELRAGLGQLEGGLRQLEQGLRGGEAGAGELASGAAEAQAAAEQLAAAASELLAGYEQIAGGLGQLTAGYDEIARRHGELADGLAGLAAGMDGLALKHPELAADEDFLRLQGAAKQLREGADQLGAALAQLNGQLGGLGAGLEQANAALKQAAAGQRELAGGLAQIAAGLKELQAGLAQAAAGQGAILERLPEMTGGAAQLAEGQAQLADGLAELIDQLGQLTDGLGQSADGLQQVVAGLESAREYLGGLSSSPDPQLAGWYLPAEAIESEEFRQALDIYMSEDRRTVKFEVVLEHHPYSVEAMDTVDRLSAAAPDMAEGTPLEGAEVAVGGISSVNNDLRHITEDDYARTVTLMLIGLVIILVVLFRSLVMPFYLVLSLILTYYMSVAAAELLFVRVLDMTGLGWAVPFFAFVMLLALGTDYSIFLMDRFREYRNLPPGEAILNAMKNMGSVIVSAAIILGGTFAAMLPAGVMSLLHIATIVLAGLFLYALIMLPLFIPVMVRLFGAFNWWPFMRRRDSAEADAGLGA